MDDKLMTTQNYDTQNLPFCSCNSLVEKFDQLRFVLLNQHLLKVPKVFKPKNKRQSNIPFLIGHFFMLLPNELAF